MAESTRKSPMSRICTLAALSVGLVALTGCSTPGGWLGTGFFDSRPKPPPLPVIANNAGGLAWSTSVGKTGGYLFVPAVGEKLIYAATNGKSVTAVADQGGRMVTRIETKTKLTAGVGFGDDVVVVANEKGEITAYDPSGRVLWTAPLAGEVLAAPVVAGTTVLVRTNDGRLVALNRADGKRKWVFSRPMPALTLRTNASVAINRGVAYVGIPGGKLAAVEVESGRPIWESTVSLPRGATELERVADIAGAPVIDEARVCVAVYQGRTTCVENLNGNVLWGRDIPSADGVAIDAKHLYVIDTDSNLYALEKVSGATLWKQEKLKLRDLGTPVVLNGKVLSGDRDGNVHYFSAADGTPVGRVSTDGSRVVALVLAGDKAIAQTEKGGIFALTAK